MPAIEWAVAGARLGYEPTALLPISRAALPPITSTALKSAIRWRSRWYFFICWVLMSFL
jgi:hypothetical protein